MFAAAVASIFMLFVFIFHSFSLNVLSDFEDSKQESHFNSVLLVSEALYTYVNSVNPTPPADLSTLVATPGFEYLSKQIPHNLGYAVTTLTGTSYTYQRFTVFIQNDERNLTESEYLSAAQNSCENAPFMTATKWCKDDGSHWFVMDNRKAIQKAINENTRKFDLLLQQMAHAYRINSSFPKTTSSGVTIPDDTSLTLTSSVGYAGPAENCTNQFYFDGAPLSCENLYDSMGTEVIYHRHSDSFITVFTTLPYLDNNGTRLTYARNLEIL